MIKQKFSQFEFVVLMALLMSIVALAIDALLPALDFIAPDISITDPKENQLLIIMIFLGLGIGSLFFCPLSDSLGRKPIVFLGFGIFIISSFICIYAKSLELMLLGRVLQGIGLSAPRNISIAMVRDKYSGNYMARIMSFITAIFILVPIVAPSLGKFILDTYNWQAIFYVQIFFCALVSLWFWLRQPETLSKPKRVRFSSYIFINGTNELLKYKQTIIGYTLISGFITGSFIVFLSASQQVFQIQYQLVEEFPFIFAALAISVGIATFLNGTLVLKFGMKRLVTINLISFFIIALCYVAVFFGKTNPSITVLLLFFAFQFFTVGFLFGNLRALVMESVGYIAGIAAAITGFISTLMAVPISILIGNYITDTALPIFMGFTLCGLFSLLILWYLEKNVKDMPFS